MERTDAVYDVIIVGAGMAGCILAAKLIKRGINPRTGEPLRIALIEAGPYLGGPARPGYGIPLRRQIFTNIRSEDSHKLPLVWPWGDGRLVGGSTFHWQAIVGLPTETEFAAWRNETGVDWSAELFEDALSEVKQVLNIHPAPDEALYEGQRRFREVSRKMGYEVRQLDHARKNCFYCGYCGEHQYCRYDARSSPAFSYLPGAEKLGVKVIPDAEVERVIIEKTGKRAIARGVWYGHGSSAKRVLADKIIVSCGTFGSSVLLKRSGYGPKEEIGIDLVVENPNIGKHVDAHPSGSMVGAYFDDPIKETNFGSVPGCYFFIESNANGDDRLIVTDGMGEMAYPDQMALSEFAPEFGQGHKRFMRMASSRLGAIYLYVAKPKSVRGQISRDGVISYEVSHPSIFKKLQEGEVIAREILQKMGARRVSPPAVQQSSTLIQTRSQGQAAMEGGTGHEVGSCRAGVEPATSVVNANFESHDVEKLLICDGSVIPRVASIGCGATVASVAVFAANRMIANHFTRA